MAQIPDQTANQKMPGWAKALIGLLVVFAIVGIMAGIGMVMVARSVMNKVTDGEGGGLKHAIEKGISKQIEKETGQKANIQITDDGVDVRDEKGQQQFAVGTKSTLPSDFPKDVPVFQPSKIISTMNMGGNSMVGFESTASSADILAFYQAQLGSKGWKGQTTTSSEGTAALYTKDSRTVMVAVAPTEQGKNGFMLSYGVFPSQNEAEEGSQ
jgi:hypothetical protein